MTTKAEAIAFAARRAETDGPQVVYESQPNHFLWCSELAWDRGQFRLAIKLVRQSHATPTPSS